jgi:hypothetical protein
VITVPANAISCDFTAPYQYWSGKAVSHIKNPTLHLPEYVHNMYRWIQWQRWPLHQMPVQHSWRPLASPEFQTLNYLSVNELRCLGHCKQEKVRQWIEEQSKYSFTSHKFNTVKQICYCFNIHQICITPTQRVCDLSQEAQRFAASISITKLHSSWMKSERKRGSII